MFVKPANLGSSVGIPSQDQAGLHGAMDLAGSFDRKIVVEAAVADAREIECAIAGTRRRPRCRRSRPFREFYDYEASTSTTDHRSSSPRICRPR
jgi:D-alanine-D-alanine ligase